MDLFFQPHIRCKARTLNVSFLLNKFTKACYCLFLLWKYSVEMLHSCRRVWSLACHIHACSIGGNGGSRTSRTPAFNCGDSWCCLQMNPEWISCLLFSCFWVMKQPILILGKISLFFKRNQSILQNLKLIFYYNFFFFFLWKTRNICIHV